MEIRKRPLTFTGPLCHFQRKLIGSIVTDNYNQMKIVGGEETWSEEHPGWRSHLGEKDVGGDFFNQKKRYIDDGSCHGHVLYDNALSSSSYRLYTGSVVPWHLDHGFTDLSWPAALASSDSSLDAKGALAVSRVLPNHPSLQVLTSLGELYKDGLPSLVGTSIFKKAPPSKALADEFLNWSFAIRPLLRDFENAYKMLKSHEMRLQQLERDSGRSVRRSYHFPEEVTVTSEVTNNVVPISYGADAFLAPPGTRTKTTRTTVNRWFEGAFTYHLPKGDNALSSLLRLRAEMNALGLGLSPELFWNLTPWSWATDWYLNTGAVLMNLSAYYLDGLILRYGYVMEHSVHEVEYVWNGDLRVSGALSPRRLRQVFVTETKKRRRANPFGFGVTYNGLTSRQWAILAALGISRS